MRKVIITISSIFGAALACIAIFLILLFVSNDDFLPDYYTTTDTAEYGIFKGNGDNEAVKSYVNSFFPDRIEDYFTDITYSYRAQEESLYRFEVYLEFRIEDADTYRNFVCKYTKGLIKKPFIYNEDFQEYTIDDEVALTVYRNFNKDGSIVSQNIFFDETKLGKIFCNDKDQRIVFVAIGVSNWANADDLCIFFQHFHIDPLEYTDRIKYSDVYQRS